MDNRYLLTPTMSIDIRLDSRQNRNPMDVATILNPLLDPQSSDDEEECSQAEEQVTGSSFYSSQPMEVNGQVPTNATWARYENYVPTLPPVQLAAEPRHVTNLTHRPAQGSRMTQVAQRSESDSLGRHSSAITRSCHRGHDHHDRRLSYPPLSIARRRQELSLLPSPKSKISDDGKKNASRKMKKKKRKSMGPHSNKPYTQEQVFWLRYFCEDRNFSYAKMYTYWDMYFPGDPRKHVPDCQGFSSRLYRENIYPTLDVNGELARKRDGSPVFKVIRVRQRRKAEFRDFPFKLVEKNPEWAVYWSWVLPEHKAMAQRILDGRGLDAAQLRKEESRRAIRMYEAEAPTKKGWFATPALHAAAVRKANVKIDTIDFNSSPSLERTAKL